MQFERIEVECYAGYKGNERPLCFRFQGKEYRIAEIIDRWYEGSIDSALPHIDYFKVRAEDGNQYIICYNKMFDGWSLVISAGEKIQNKCAKKDLINGKSYNSLIFNYSSL